MKLIAGLGNPEGKFNWTRHNTGFLALDFDFKLKGLKWNTRPRLGAINSQTDDILFIKPQDYYNLSGQAVREYMHYYKVDLVDILVVCDDFNLRFGEIRYRSSGSAGGNNGLKSIAKELKTEEFARLRVGTGNDELRNQIGDVDFVLSKFTPEEKKSLPKVLKEVADKIDFWTNL